MMFARLSRKAHVGRSFASIAVAGLLAACGGATTAGAPSSDDGSPTPAAKAAQSVTAKAHRATAEACAAHAPIRAGEPGGPTIKDDCTSDAQCAADPVCVCNGKNTFGEPGAANACRFGNCRVDADCATGACSPSGVFWHDSYACRAASSVTIDGYYCHTREDECINDGDCSEKPNGFCGYDPRLARWTCAYATDTVGICRVGR